MTKVDYSAPAVLDGETYCAPWCGFKCTKAAYDRATEEGTRLRDLMNNHAGGGWMLRVWENSGWHYEVNKGQLHIYPLMRGSNINGDWVLTGYHSIINGAAGSVCKTDADPIRLAKISQGAYAAKVERAQAELKLMGGKIDA